MDVISLSIPGFFILMGVELLVAWLARRKLYRLNDTLNDLGAGIFQQVVVVVSGAALFGNYVLLYTHARVAVPWPQDSWGTWVVCYVAADFLYYLYHRFSHESAIGWAAHVVHHQSEEYNLSVALRQGAFQPWQSHLFYLPLAIVGFPPVVYATCIGLNSIYQFWLHTRLIRRMGPAEWLLSTPSHHRVHHGANLKYLDRNYGGTFIIWDRMFGSFQVEQEEPRYGVLEPLHSWNPFIAQFRPWLGLWRKAASMPGIWNKVQAIFRAPGWSPDGVDLAPQKAAQLEASPLYDARAPGTANAYALVLMFCAVLVTVALLFFKSAMTGWEVALLCAMVLWTLQSMGAIFEQPVWLNRSELGRLLVGAALGSGLALSHGWAAGWVGAGVCLVCMGWWLALRGTFRAAQVQPAAPTPSS